MSENFGRYNEYIDNIDFKGEQTLDSTNENLIKDKARAYVEKDYRQEFQVKIMKNYYKI